MSFTILRRMSKFAVPAPALSPRRRRARDAVRQRIFAAARPLFSAHGYDAVTMQQIAAALDYTPGALYRHFRDKDALVRALVAEDFRAFFAAFAHVPAIADPVRRIREAGRAYVEFGLTHPHHYRLLFLTPAPPGADAGADADADPGAHEPSPAREAYRLVEHAAAEALAAGRFRPAYRDAGALAQALWASVHGVVALAITVGDAPWLAWRPTRVTDRLLADALLVGLVRPGDPALADPLPPLEVSP